MADIRIKDIPTTASVMASTDFIELDGDDGSQKLDKPGLLASIDKATATTDGLMAKEDKIILGAGQTKSGATNAIIAGVSNTVSADNSVIIGGNGNAVSSQSTVAEGYQNTNNSAGHYSHIEGYQNVNDGYGAHVEGRQNINAALRAHVEGFGNTATSGAVNGHVEGDGNTIENSSVHAEGYHNSGKGDTCHVEGYDNEIDTTGLASHAEGYQNHIDNNYSHAEGRNNEIHAQYSHIEGYTNKINSTGETSHAEGMNNEIDAQLCHAEGFGNIIKVDGHYSHAEGENNIIDTGAWRSHAEGSSQRLLSQFCHAENFGNIVAHPYSHAEGFLNTTNKEISIVDGSYVDHGNGTSTVTLSTNDGTDFTTDDPIIFVWHGQGEIVVIISSTTNTITFHTPVTGDPTNSGVYVGGKDMYAVPVVENLTAPPFNIANHVEGHINVASGHQAHAEGYFNRARGDQAHVQGRTSFADGFCSDTRGYNNKARGYCSSSEGDFADSFRLAQRSRASGKFNINGDAQYTELIMMVETTDGNASRLRLGKASGAIEELTLEDYKTYMLTANIVGRRTNGTDYGAYKIEACVTRENGASSMAILGTPVVTSIFESDSAWDVALAIDGSYQLWIEVVGNTGKNVNWVGHIQLVEVGS